MFFSLLLHEACSQVNLHKYPVDTITIISLEDWDSIVVHSWPKEFHKFDSTFYRLDRIIQSKYFEHETNIVKHYLDSVILTNVYFRNVLVSYSLYDLKSDVGKCYAYGWEDHKLELYYEFNSNGMHGVYKEYADEVVWKEMNYSNGIPNGTFIERNQNGELRTMAFYNQNGKLDGYFRIYGPNGIVKLVSFYKNGIKQGLEHHYRLDGSLEKTIEFREDQPISETLYSMPIPQK
jgi:antitoxin component YwqK of YwqJK toxin-antitoxin module